MWTLFSETNVVSLFFSYWENTIYGGGVLFSAHSCKGNFFITVHRQIFSYFTNIIWDKKYIPMRIWPYASSSLHVTDLETMYLSRLSEYGTEENLDWIYAIWFWPVLHLTFLVVFVFLLYFHLLCPPPPPCHHGLCLLPLCWSWQSLCLIILFCSGY